MDVPAYHPFRSEQAKEQYLAMYDTRASGWPVASDTVMAGTSFGQTFVRISGPKSAPPLVLLPGANATSLMWYLNIEALSRGFRTYAVDSIYDYGRSVPARAPATPQDLVNWLDELFDTLELGNNINLLGMSYGGWLASQYAMHRPGRLAKMVLLAPACTVLPLRKVFLVRAILSALPLRFFTKSFLNWMLGDFARQSDMNRVIMEYTVNDVLLARRCFKPIRFVPPTVLKDEELQSLNVPTLFLVGENEVIYSARKSLERLHQVAPHIKTGLIRGAGHDLNIARSALVNEKVLEFLQSVT